MTHHLIVEDAARPGTFEIGVGFRPDPARPGTFITSPFIIEDPARPGTFIEYNPTDYLPTADPLTSHRSVRRRYELIDSAGGSISNLDGVRGATLKQSAQATLKRGGQASITDVGQDINWLTARIRAVYEIENGPTWGLGVYLPSKPFAQWSGGVRRWDVQLLDVAAVLAETRIDEDYALDAGTIVTNAVRTLLALAGETSAAITDSTKTLTTARVWPVGTSILSIINDLLDSIGYFSLSTDGDGHLTARPYVRPADRPEEWEFVDGSDCIYRPELSIEQDLYSVPNHVLATTRGTGDEPGLSVSVYNDNPDSPFSRANRGRTISAEPIETDATDLDSLETIARRALIEKTTPTSTIVIDALPVPVDANAAVRFRSRPAGIDGRHVVTNVDYGATDTDLAQYTLREVVDV